MNDTYIDIVKLHKFVMMYDSQFYHFVVTYQSLKISNDEL